MKETIEKLRAENAALHQRVADLEVDRDLWRRISERLAREKGYAQEAHFAAVQRVAELKKDAARYRWLRHDADDALLAAAEQAQGVSDA
jgi:hypothetical protein